MMSHIFNKGHHYPDFCVVSSDMTVKTVPRINDGRVIKQEKSLLTRSSQQLSVSV